MKVQDQLINLELDLQAAQLRDLPINEEQANRTIGGAGLSQGRLLVGTDQGLFQ